MICELEQQFVDEQAVFRRGCNLNRLATAEHPFGDQPIILLTRFSGVVEPNVVIASGIPNDGRNLAAMQ